MSIRFGVSPIAWVNDDMPELGAGTALETIVADARDIGFAGIELGGVFPRDAATLKPLLDGYGLDLVGGWFSGNLLVHDAKAEIAAAQDHLNLLKAMGSTVFVHAETSNAIHGEKAIPLSRTPRLDEAGWKLFGERLTQFADYVAGQGLRFAYHHHLGTVVERPEDLHAFLKATGEVVGLTLDTGHAALGGIDPVAAIKAHPKRIAHVHCKDIRAQVFAGIQAQGRSFLDGVLAGMFTVPGDGGLDYAAVMRALAEISYSGWIVVEAEQDPAIADPRQYGELGLRTLEREAAAAGLRRAA
ncbi:MAG: myo-inosose-2 dehydratase [Phenylobacterium sp.]|uniref:myo-inosose-2 dehydratase n=1 Tax=Phenylobacterium sp. TaxID=1871053 RepID=UPI0012247BC7|nr:myo-inosose-2 dehydratase [Phenylobacterium sp.]TAJ72432.1 MAG: myo-inosose-2 dehydratase [Phenylobacterium sp.]